MSIQSEISRILENVAAAYSALSAKGATLPDAQNTDNLASTIESVPAGEAMSIETIRAICYTPSDFELNYTELEFIEGSGTQYIDTLFTPDSNTRVVLDADVPKETSGATYVMGVQDWTSGAYFQIRITSSGTQYLSDYGSGWLAVVEPDGRTIFDKNKNVCTIGETAVTNTAATFTCASTLMLLAGVTTSGTKSISPGIIYACQIYNNDTLVRDFVPCIRNSDGAYGLYDKVNEEFYSDATGGSFTGA